MQKQRAEKQAEEQSKTMQLNVVRLCFRVFLPGEGNKFTRVLNPVLSDPIYDSSELLTRISQLYWILEADFAIFRIPWGLGLEDLPHGQERRMLHWQR